MEVPIDLKSYYAIFFFEYQKKLLIYIKKKRRTRGYSMVSRNTEQNLSKRRKIIKNGARMPNLCISKIETPLKQAGENASASIRS